MNSLFSHKRYLVALALSAVVTVSPAEDLDSKHLAKAPASVVALARANTPQKLMVELEYDDIATRQNEKRRARGLAYNDEPLRQEVNRELDARKKEVFRGGALGKTVVVDDHEHVPILVVEVPDWPALRQLLATPRVKAVHEIRRSFPATSQSLPLIKQPAAVAAGKLGAGTRVAVIDTSVDVRDAVFSTTGTFPACRPPGADSTWGGDPIGTGKCRIAEAVDFSGPENCWTAGCGGDAYHGLLDAGIVARVAPKTKISALKVFTTNGYSNTQIIGKAISWVIQNVGSSGNRIVAINLSLDNNPGVAYNSECSGHVYEAYFAQLLANGVLPIVAAGNSASPTGVSDPACVRGAVRVGAVYDANLGQQQYGGSSNCSDAVTGVDRVPCFSNSGPLITLLAPGAYISLSSVGASGTSQAAPHVAGATAVLRGDNAFPGDSATATISRMVNNGVKVADTKNNVVKPRLNLSGAVTNITVPYSPPTVIVPIITALLAE